MTTLQQWLGDKIIALSTIPVTVDANKVSPDADYPVVVFRRITGRTKRGTTANGATRIQIDRYQFDVWDTNYENVVSVVSDIEAGMDAIREVTADFTVIDAQMDSAFDRWDSSLMAHGASVDISFEVEYTP